MDETLVREYSMIKERISQLEANKIKTKTELDIKEKELTEIVTQLNELGITDLTKIDEIVETKRKEFEDQLNTLKGQLDAIQGA
jgi:chromosome segregation ATPase